MADSSDVLDKLAALKAEYERLDAAREKVKQQIVALAVTAFREGREPVDIYAAQPFSHVWLRGQVRKAGVPRAKPGTKPKAIAVQAQTGTPAAGPTMPES